MRIKQNEYSAYDNKTEWLPVLHILREPLDLDNFLEAGKPGTAQRRRRRAGFPLESSGRTSPTFLKKGAVKGPWLHGKSLQPS